ncbi:uncharacterized protein LOC127510907 isoform X5 [Ctenopharyngodon idella]|uniref:uncharacterized protein LOC127510907 isoform X4 n=1 Tax=Ctenopharyngodon idella TaxID=7959 RepID=UPI0022311B97|nr:uncharacterized protein LOC127510907 isoform X4 [Ctenopharyngodon idella]XP_051747025.1 uncharacterized protein LOC127510907 isoform X5 [Ctenopharyngodon idella]
MDIWTAEKILLLSFLMKGVLCRDFSISLPDKIEALSGSCVIIKCTFEIKDEYDKELTENATGCWHKDGTEKIVFNSSMSSQNSIIKGNITGRLHEKDCTTIFYDVRSNYSGTYHFRLEGEGGLKWTYSEPHVQIEVIESPPKPTVKLYEEQKEVQDQEEVLERSSVSLRCSAETLCSSPPPTLTWSSTPRIPLSESSRQQELISDLNFTATHRHHRVTFTCTITYQLLDKNKTAQDNITLHVQYAPKISPSSSCNRTDVIVCFCEVDGNPSPELEWHLSGPPVSNSSDTFISEERLGSTGLRSSITLHQSLAHTSLQCVGNNTRGTASQLFQLNLFPPGGGHHLLSILIGAAVGVFLMMKLCVIIYCARRENSRSSQTKQEDTTGIIMTDKDIQQDCESESVYANNVILSPAEAATLNRQESLHYASIDFKNLKPESEEIRGISSLTTDYAVISYSGKVRETKSSVGGGCSSQNKRMDIQRAEKIILLIFLLKGVCCRDFSISLPEKIEALSGSCVIIKCIFEIEDEYDKELNESAATGLWLKYGYNVNIHQVFNSRDPKPDHFKGEITGKLHEKNCTTVFYNVSSIHNGKYYFRIESGRMKYTYSERENISTINVIKSPSKPTVKLYEEQKEVQDQEEVLEGSSVSLRCSAETLCSSPPPTLTWSSTPRIPLSESSRQQELISDLNFTATHRHHRVTFTCTITYQLLDKNKTAQDSITLHVQYAPQISTSSSCVSGDVTECFCEVDGNPSPELEWHLSGRPVTNSSDTFISEERLGSTGLRSSITIHQSLTHTSLQCVGRNTRGTASQLFQLNLSPLQFTEYQQVTVSLLIILMLILVLYALTVGLGIYKIRQLSTKLKAQNEAADTYASLQLSAPPSEYETLNIKRDDTL